MMGLHSGLREAMPQKWLKQVDVSRAVVVKDVPKQTTVSEAPPPSY